MLPSSRTEAKATGSTYYYTGKPCKYQHVAKRLTSSGECHDCSKVRSASDHTRERMRAYHKVYQVQKAEAIREYRKTRRPKHVMTPAVPIRPTPHTMKAQTAYALHGSGHCG